METMKRFMCVAVALLLATANVCRAEDSLEDKLAKLEAASKTSQSTPKSTVRVRSTDSSATDILRGKVKTLAERLDEMDIRQKGMQEADKGLDAKLAELERKLETSTLESESRVQKVHDALNAGLAELERKIETSKAQSQSRTQKAHDTLYAKLAELDSKVQGLEAQAKAAAAKQTLARCRPDL